MNYLLIFGITTIIFMIIDLVWLGVIAKNLYNRKLGFILSPQINWGAAIVFYLIYIFGILFFALLPALSEQRWQLALINGAVFGLMCYATYDLTNMATIKNWPVSIVFIDILWGMVLTSSTTVISYFISSRIY